MNRRRFLTGLVTTAAGLLLPYEPKRVYSFGKRSVGYLYAPYIPLLKLPELPPFPDLLPRKAVLRYAKKHVRSDFYGTVRVMDL